ncbi:hypothetical protein [Hymenobacter tenuis]
MKAFLTLSFFLPVFAFGQAPLPDLATALGVAYPDFDLAKHVVIEKGFDQSNMSEIAIDAKIESIVKSQSAKPLLEVSVPYNTKKLVYLGRIHPVKTNLFSEDQFYFKYLDQAIADEQAHVYKYENLYIATRNNTLLDRYLVYYTIRAILLIKHRLPSVQTALFEKTAELPTNFLAASRSATYINMTKNYFVTFDGTLPLPSNNAYFGPLQVGFIYPTYGKELYPNTQVMYFNRNTVLNAGSAGPVPIYPAVTDPAEKFHTYMKDGFIHSFVHERLHDWVFQFTNLNSLADFLRNKSQSSGLVSNYYPLEEAVVNNTTNSLFEAYPNNGGLSGEVLRFYQKEFALSINAFKVAGAYDQLRAELVRFAPNATQDAQLFIIDLKSKANTPR